MCELGLHSDLNLNVSFDRLSFPLVFFIFGNAARNLSVCSGNPTKLCKFIFFQGTKTYNLSVFFLSVDLTYTLHIRRRTFFYVFNIIVPCVMLSVLTLLTFWLPTTSGTKTLPKGGFRSNRMITTV